MSASYRWAIVSRIPLVGIGGLALFKQVQIISEFYGAGNTTLMWVAPLVSITLAFLPIWLERAWHERRYLTSVGFLIMFLVGTAFSLTNVIGRVSEFRSGKGASAVAIAQQHAEAKSALARAEAEEATASVNVDKYCSATTTIQTRGKKVRTETTAADPRCDTWTAELGRRQSNTILARRQLTAVPPVPEIDADTKRTAAMLHLDPATVEQWQPALMPGFLELTMIFCFLFAFRPLDYTVEEAPQLARALPDNVIPFERDGWLSDQKMINGLVSAWIADVGLDTLSDVQVRSAAAMFNTWLRTRKVIVGETAFGIALNDLNIAKRVKQGRKHIAGPDYQPRKPKRKTAR